MSENGGSDLDVFKTLTKAPPGARSPTLVGLAAPPPPPSSRTSALPPAPPPPPSVLLHSKPGQSRPGQSKPAQPHPDVSASAAEAEEAEEVEADAVEDHEDQQETAGNAPNFEESGDTDIFQLQNSIPERSTLERSAIGIGLGATSNLLPSLTPLPLPPPPSTIGLPLPPSNINLPPPAPPSNISSLPPPSVPRPPAPSYVTLSRPPPPPPSTSSSGASEWDDEDDKTTVYTKDGGLPSLLMRTAPTRTRTIPDAPPPPMSRPSAPVPMPMPTSQTPTIQSLRIGDAPASVPPGPTTTRTPLLFGGLAVALLGVVLFFLLRPSTGGLVVTVAGPGNKPLDKVEVVLDGKVVCATSPCVQKELSAGSHVVKARAEGYEPTAEAAVLISGQQDAVHNVRLVQLAGSGVKVTAVASGLRLLVDGRAIGPLPQEVTDLASGSHVLRVEGEAYEPWEQTVQTSPDEPQSIGPLKLRVKTGIVKLTAGKNAQGAKITLETGTEQRSVPSLPMTLGGIDPSKSTSIVGSKRGFQSFRRPISFEDGIAEKEVEVALEADSPALAAAPRNVNPAPVAAPRNVTPTPVAAKPAAASGTGTLNINSIPAANIILDGRPLGSTPKVGLSVPVGPHTVVFVKDGERQTKAVNVGAGQTQTVAYRFK